ncbi:hypothetical protein G6F68_015587 [Rhizopus microsporus]|nr:hypothetical protein G6F68_015587 [Rhizopus microsporus]
MGYARWAIEFFVKNSRAAPILRLRIRTKKAAPGFTQAAAVLSAAAGLSPCGWSLQPGDNRTGSSPGPGPRQPGRGTRRDRIP